MRRRGVRGVIVLTAVFQLLAGPPAAGGASYGTGTTLRGEVLDLACFIGHNGRGADHAPCARKCVKGGQPMGLLASDGTIYVLMADHADATAYNRAKEYAGKQVEVRGTVASEGSLKGITVLAVKPL